MHIAAPPDGYCLAPTPEQREYMRRSVYLASGGHRIEELRGDRVVVVGDYTARVALSAGIRPLLVIVDCATMRRRVDCPEPPPGYRVVRVVNPRGLICSWAWRAIAESMDSGGHTLILVDGEEDLLAIPAILELGEGLVAYGIPWAGLHIAEAETVAPIAELIARAAPPVRLDAIQSGVYMSLGYPNQV